MAKDKSKKQTRKQATGKQTKAPRAKSASPRSKKQSSPPRVKAVVRRAGKRAVDLAANPAVAEVVAATLVAAAAALKNPKKARDLAASVGDELESASANAAGKGSAFWQLALDIARRSVDAMGAEKSAAKSRPGKKKPKKKAAKI